MSYKIIVDSCCDLPEDLRKDEHFLIVPLSIEVDRYKIVDDKTFNQKELLEKMKASPNAPKTSCPSPEEYMKAFLQADDIYCVTLSGNLSGSYNSAMLGKNLCIEENGEKNIEVIDSCSASSGEVLIAMKIFELAKSGKNFKEISSEAVKFRNEMHTMFVLESLENLRKNGRLSNIKAAIASVLNIKPIMVGTRDGQIEKTDQARGMKKALTKMVDIIASSAEDFSKKDIAIAHCNCYDRAVEVMEYVKSKCNFRNIFIVDTAGISTVYAYDGGIVVAF